MGVMTVSSQNFMEIDMPGWWLSGAGVDLDFRNGRYYDSSNILAGLSNLLTISRASIGYARTSGGTLTQFSSGQFRQTDLGLLIEDARTNLCPSSGDLRSATEGNAVSGWTAQATTATLSGTAPDGSGTATQITATAGTGDHERFRGFATPVTDFYSFSVFLKAGTTNWAQIQINGLQTDHCAFFNLAAGTIGTLGTNTSASIEPYANGWYRCIASSTNTISSAGNLIPSVMPATADNQAFNWNAAGTETIFAWGAQMEEAPFASSYIPTTTTSATRAADSVSIAGSAQTAINNATGSIVAWVNGSPVPIFPANIVDSNGTNLLGYDATDHGLTSITSTLATGNTANASGRDKLGTAWDAAGRRLVLNGGTVATDAVAQTPSATQKLGSASATSNFVYAYVDRLALWNTKLASATLQSLTQ